MICEATGPRSGGTTGLVQPEPEGEDGAYETDGGRAGDVPQPGLDGVEMSSKWPGRLCFRAFVDIFGSKIMFQLGDVRIPCGVGAALSVGAGPRPARGDRST